MPPRVKSLTPISQEELLQVQQNPQNLTKQKLCPHFVRRFGQKISGSNSITVHVSNTRRRDAHALILLAHTRCFATELLIGSSGKEGIIILHSSSIEELYATEFQRVIDFLMDIPHEKLDEPREFRLNCKNQQVVKRILKKLESHQYRVKLERRKHARFFLIFPKGVRLVN